MYYDFKSRRLPAHERGGMIDLRFATIMNDLELPLRDAHDSLSDAVMAGLAFVKLRSLLEARCVRQSARTSWTDVPSPVEDTHSSPPIEAATRPAPGDQT